MDVSWDDDATAAFDGRRDRRASRTTSVSGVRHAPPSPLTLGHVSHARRVSGERATRHVSPSVLYRVEG